MGAVLLALNESGESSVKFKMPTAATIIIPITAMIRGLL